MRDGGLQGSAWSRPFCGQRPQSGPEDYAKAALAAPAPRLTTAGLRNQAAVLAFHQTEGRLPMTGGKTARERALGVWLMRRRQEAAAGTSPPPTVTGCPPSPAGTPPPPARPTTRRAGTSGSRTFRRSGPSAGTGRGMPRPMTHRSARWVCGCTASGRTNAPAGCHRRRRSS